MMAEMVVKTSLWKAQSMRTTIGYHSQCHVRYESLQETFGENIVLERRDDVWEDAILNAPSSPVKWFTRD